MKIEIIDKTSIALMERSANDFLETIKDKRVTKTNFQTFSDGISRRYIYIIEYENK